MKNLHTFEEFLNEAKIEKMASAWYYQEVKVPGFETGASTVKSDKDTTKAASALVNYWEKKKPFETAGFTISPERLKTLEKLSEAKVGEVISITVVDGKTDKDYKIEIEVRDKYLGRPAEKHLYVKVQRIG